MPASPTTARRFAVLTIVIGGVIPGMSTADLDDFVPPRNIIGLEVHRPGTMPTEFQQLRTNTNDGVIAVWTTH